jgi:hypothetical protein
MAKTWIKGEGEFQLIASSAGLVAVERSGVCLKTPYLHVKIFVNKITI